MHFALDLTERKEMSILKVHVKQSNLSQHVNAGGIELAGGWVELDVLIDHFRQEEEECTGQVCVVATAAVISAAPGQLHQQSTETA